MVERTLKENFSKHFLAVSLFVISLLAVKIIMDYHKFRENPPSASDHLSTVHLSDGRRYRWLTKLWCNETQTSHLCYYLPEESNVHGHAFHENTLRLAKKLHIFDHTNRYVDPEKYLKENDPVFLTAANSEFFGPVKVAIRSVQEYFPNRSIIFYDLGMNDHQVKELKSFCNLEYVRFPFEDFPGYFRHLRQYRWKPVIIAVRATFKLLYFIIMNRSSWRDKVSLVFTLTGGLAVRNFCLLQKTLVRHGAVWYMDSSDVKYGLYIYKLRSYFKTFFKSETERKFSFLLHSSAHHGIYSVTSSMSYVFLPTNITVMKLRRPVCMEAGLSLVFRTREVIETIFVWLLACALEENCMNTPEAKLYCKFNHGHFNHYANCHRYDQAITNLLLANQLGYDTKRWSSELNYFFEIRRHQSNATFKPYTCPVSNILPNH
ncbi:hypothetical protein D918_06776 [Trichuris suis]|nr:hypothetical protein D918_06776 [Trichuris suis]